VDAAGVLPLEGLQAHAAPAELADGQRPSSDGQLELPAWDGLQAALTGMPQQHFVRALALARAATEPCAPYLKWAHLFYTCAITPSAISLSCGAGCHGFGLASGHDLAWCTSCDLWS